MDIDNFENATIGCINRLWDRFGYIGEFMMRTSIPSTNCKKDQARLATYKTLLILKYIELCWKSLLPQL
jgi:hypothetical protein